MDGLVGKFVQDQRRCLLRRWYVLSWDQNFRHVWLFFRHESSKSFGRCVLWKRVRKWSISPQNVRDFSGSLISTLMACSKVSTILRTFFGAISCQIAQISSRNGNDRVTGHSQRQKQAKMIESVWDYWDFSLVTGPPQRQKQREQNFVRILWDFCHGSSATSNSSQIVVFFGFFNDWLRSGSSKTCSKFSKYLG